MAMSPEDLCTAINDFTLELKQLNDQNTNEPMNDQDIREIILPRLTLLLPLWNLHHECHKMIHAIVLGPAGEPCSACGGSGRKKDADHGA